MDKAWILGAALVLFLLALPLVSFGTAAGRAGAWMTGLAFLALAGLLAPLTRFAGKDEGNGEKPADDAGDEEDEER